MSLNQTLILCLISSSHTPTFLSDWEMHRIEPSSRHKNCIEPSSRHKNCKRLLFFMISCCQPDIAQAGLFFLPKSCLTWVNGIGYNYDHMENGRVSISSLFGGRPVLFCHNPTAMTTEDDYLGYLGDLTQAGSQKLGSSSIYSKYVYNNKTVVTPFYSHISGRITAEVDALVRHLQQAVESVGPQGRVIHLAHSQGALITFLASKRLTKAEMAQIEVICFGGAEAIQSSHEFPFARCVNYYAINDPLLFVVPSADKALRSGFFSLFNEPEFIFLTPRAGDPVLDHGLFGPTYREALAWEGKRYQQMYLPVWYPLVTSWIMYGESIHVQISRLFQWIVRFLLTKILLPMIAFVMHVNDLIYQQVIGLCIQAIHMKKRLGTNIAKGYEETILH